jgi:hypothetical protein
VHGLDVVSRGGQNGYISLTFPHVILRLFRTFSPLLARFRYSGNAVDTLRPGEGGTDDGGWVGRFLPPAPHRRCTSGYSGPLVKHT